MNVCTLKYEFLASSAAATAASNLSGWNPAAFPYASGSMPFPVNYSQLQLFNANPNLLMQMQLRPGATVGVYEAMNVDGLFNM